MNIPVVYYALIFIAVTISIIILYAIMANIIKFFKYAFSLLIRDKETEKKIGKGLTGLHYK